MSPSGSPYALVAHLAFAGGAVLDCHRLPGRRPVPGPLINGGKDPKHQKLGVDVLFWALVVVCVGSFIGNYLTIAHVMPQSGTSGWATRATNTLTWAACGRSASLPALPSGWC